MTQKHVDLLIEAITIDDVDQYLCNRIGYITGQFYYPAMRNTKYGEEDYVTLTELIQLNIMSNLSTGCDSDEEQTYMSTAFCTQGMTRTEWVKTILTPLALALPEEAV